MKIKSSLLPWDRPDFVLKKHLYGLYVPTSLYYLEDHSKTCTLPETNIAPENRSQKRRFLLETTAFRGYVSFREGKWFGSPQLISHEWPFGRGTARSLGGRNRSPWLMTTYESWDDPPSKWSSMPPDYHIFSKRPPISLHFSLVAGWEIIPNCSTSCPRRMVSRHSRNKSRKND